MGARRRNSEARYDLQQQAFDAYLAKVRAVLPELPVTVYERLTGTDWRPLFDLPLGAR